MNRVSVGIVVVGVIALGGLVASRLGNSNSQQKPQKPQRATPVEVEAIRRGVIEKRRTLIGTIEARSRFVVTANMSGRVDRLLADLSDAVTQGQVIAELDAAEQNQGVVQARAAQMVAQANLANANRTFEIFEQELARGETLFQRGVISKNELDTTRAKQVSQRTAIQVADAELKRSQAQYQQARIRSGYSQVVANWSGAKETRYVAQRHVAEGDTVGPNDPLMTIVDLDPLNVVVHIGEGEYAHLHEGQEAKLTTDGFPGRHFDAVVKRIAPVFNANSRQARVELQVNNSESLLKPGMFARVDILLERMHNATIVPQMAATSRGGQTGVFVVSEDGTKVSWRPVEFGIQQAESMQVLGPEIVGRVVTLGQQFLEDGGAVAIFEGK